MSQADYDPEEWEARKPPTPQEAALRMVLMFHDASAWNREKTLEWIELQKDAGVPPKADCTSRTLCVAVRHVLGIDTDHEDGK